MKKLMFVALILAAGISFADNYSPSKVPTGTTSPDVMPGTVNFQGLLRDPATGNPYKDGIYTLECRLYTALTGTKAIWGAKYQAYVREGYFNIMLGSTGTPLSGCTYPNPTDLWKALWYSGDNRELYLGVTPWQGSDGQTIADADKRKEITPRQQLLAAPFALRAQKAQYADAAVTDFKVPGDLTVAGQIKSGDGSVFGLKNVSSTDMVLNIGDSTTTPYNTNVKGYHVNITSGTDISLNAGFGLGVQLGAGHALGVGGNGGIVRLNDLSKIEAYSDSAYVGWDKNDKTRGGMYFSKNNDNLRISADNVVMSGKQIGKSEGAKLEVIGSQSLVIGAGELRWKASSGQVTRPFRIDKVEVTLDANTSSLTTSLESKLNFGGVGKAVDYAWMIVGYEFLPDGLNETQWRSPELRALEIIQDGHCTLHIAVDEAINKSRKFVVTLLGINTNFLNY